MYKTLLSIFTILLLGISEANANKNIIKNLKEGGKIIFIRHALAPGSGDPENFDLNWDCKTQRNLSSQGTEQSKRLGIFFLKIKFLSILFYQVSGVDAKIPQNMHLETMNLYSFKFFFFV